MQFDRRVLHCVASTGSFQLMEYRSQQVVDCNSAGRDNGAAHPAGEDITSKWLMKDNVRFS